MIPVQFSECISSAKIPEYVEELCVTYCDYESQHRCKETVDLGPGLAPTTYQSSVVCYTDCTKKRFKNQIEYETRMKPKHFGETRFVLPKRWERTFASIVEQNVERTRRWYRSSVELKPKTWSSSTVHNINYLKDIEQEDNNDTNNNADEMFMNGNHHDNDSSSCNGTMSGIVTPSLNGLDEGVGTSETLMSGPWYDTIIANGGMNGHVEM